MTHLNIIRFDIRSEEGRSQPKTVLVHMGAPPLALELIRTTKIRTTMSLCTWVDYHSVNEIDIFITACLVIVNW